MKSSQIDTILHEVIQDGIYTDLARWCEDYPRSESAVRVMYKVSEVGRITLL